MHRNKTIIAVNPYHQQRRRLVMNKIGIALALLALGLSACEAPAAAPTPEVVIVTATPLTATEVPTEMPPTATPTEIPPTPTLEPTATSTPDYRVVDLDPRKAGLTKDELPQEGRYYLYDESPHRNSEIISGWGRDEGQRYLAESGRIDGWWREYVRGTETSRVPEVVFINVIIYNKLEGPSVTDKVLGKCSDEYKELEPAAIGDFTTVCLHKEMQPKGVNYIAYELQVNYRNIRAQIWASGDEGSFDLEWLMDIARKQLDKIMSFPLSDVVIYSP